MTPCNRSSRSLSLAFLRGCSSPRPGLQINKERGGNLYSKRVNNSRKQNDGRSLLQLLAILLRRRRHLQQSGSLYSKTFNSSRKQNGGRSLLQLLATPLRGRRHLQQSGRPIPRRRQLAC